MWTTMKAVLGSSVKGRTNVFNSFYELTATDIDGKRRSMDEWRNRVVMIVNVASN